MRTLRPGPFSYQELSPEWVISVILCRNILQKYFFFCTSIIQVLCVFNHKRPLKRGITLSDVAADISDHHWNQKPESNFNSDLLFTHEMSKSLLITHILYQIPLFLQSLIGTTLHSKPTRHCCLRRKGRERRRGFLSFISAPQEPEYPAAHYRNLQQLSQCPVQTSSPTGSRTTGNTGKQVREVTCGSEWE